MGCAQSSGELDDGARPSSVGSRRLVNNESAAGAAKQAKQVSVAARSSEFETNAMATYSTGGGAGELFGLFAEDAKTKLATKDELNRGGQSRVHLAVCAEDDGCVETTGDGLVIAQGVAMTIPYTVLVAGVAEDDKPNVEQEIEMVFAIVDQHFNNWNDESQIAKISKLPGGKSMPVSKELRKLFEVVDHAFQLTDGIFDPTISAVLTTSRTSLVKHAKPVTSRDVEHLKHAVGWDSKIKFNAAKDKVTILNTNTAIELGGIAKGYAVDLLVDGLTKRGFSDVYVDWGADIRAQGKHPDGRPWRTALVDVPELSKLFGLWKEDRLREAIHPDHGLYLADLEDMAVATSGDYFQIEKFGFHHIVRPHDLGLMRASATSLGSVSIFSETCAMADAVATAAMTLPTAKAAASWLNGLVGTGEVAGYCLVGRDGSQIHQTSPPLIAIQRLTDDSDSSTPNDDSGGSSSDSNTADLAPWLELSPRIEAIASVGGGSAIHLDSIATLSLHPPMVSFSVQSDKIVGGSSVDLIYLSGEDVDLRKAVLHSTLIFQPDSKFCDSHTHLKTTVENVVQCGSLSTATARVLSAHPVQSSQLISVGDNKVTLSLSPVPGGLSTPERLRAMMRRNPSPVAVITFRDSDGSVYGMTATSVRLAHGDRSIVTFNAQKDGLFYLALTTPRAVVLNFPTELETGSALAQRFTSDVTLTGHEQRSLLTGSFRDSPGAVMKDCISLHCTIVEEVDGGDHALLSAVVTTITLPSYPPESILTRRNGEYQIL